MRDSGLLNSNVGHGTAIPTYSNAIKEHQLMLIYYPSYVFIQNKYLRWYRFIVENSTERNKHLTEYTENHHILPRSVFPKFSNLRKNQWNCAKLTYREHFLAHWLLTKCMIDPLHKMQMLFALSKMSGGVFLEKRTTTSWQYALMRKSASDAGIILWKDPEFRQKEIKRRNSLEYRTRMSIITKTRYENIRLGIKSPNTIVTDNRTVIISKIKKYQNDLIDKGIHNFQIKENREKISKSVSESNKRRATGTRWWNNGIQNKQSKECPGDNWVLGKIGRKNQHE